MMTSKMGYELKLVRSFRRIEPHKLGLAVAAGCLTVSLLFVAFFMASVSFSKILGIRLMITPENTPAVLVIEGETSASTGLGNTINKSAQEYGATGCATSLCQRQESSAISIAPQNPATNVNSDLLSANPSAPSAEKEPCDPEFGSCETDGGESAGADQRPAGVQSNVNKQDELSCDAKSGLCKIDHVDNDRHSRITPLSGIAGDERKKDEQEKPLQKPKPLCDTSIPKSDICDLAGEVRIHGNSSSVILVDADRELLPAIKNGSYTIRPYARKEDKAAMEHVREVVVSTMMPAKAATVVAACDVHHDVPAIVFSVSGYTGNFFHDFTDVLIPLFLTSRPFNGEVQFLITDYSRWWVNKYSLIFKQLTRYDIIDFNKEDKVHCYSRVIVGLRRHKELSIDPSKPPHGFSMVEFAKFMRTTFSLERDTVTRADSGRKPRLLIISRKWTRSLVNVGKVIQMARKLGFEVVVGEMGVTTHVVVFARLVNSCDVLMGVHGAGLTNLVFLPTNGTLIQIVPWGGLEWISNFDFGEPAVDTHLKYLQYTIKAEESTLLQQYPRDHPVFKDPMSIHKQGWGALRSIFLDKQNVRLDVKRFRPVLKQALSGLLLQ